MMGVRVDQVRFAEAMDLIGEYIQEGTTHQIVTLGVEMAMLAYRDPELRRILRNADLVTPDSIGVVWGARNLGSRLPERVCGVDILGEVARVSVERKWPFFLLGGAPGVAEKAVEKLRERWGDILPAGAHHGYFQNPEQPISVITQAAPKILFVGLGVPMQENWIARYKDQLGVPVLIGVGGSFDVISGRLSRAPSWMIKLGIEWLYRLIQEPGRAKRMLVLPHFALKILWHKWGRSLRRIS
ncbi:MAG: WecB/TagA/CpsF family glycosyltransferase [Armatimonadetes bacterium]|nr:WecB/TagA/CpsF family glycosyltransferase [Armatimonadota bacterium]